MDFNKHSLIFFRNYKDANPNFEYEFMQSALDYVRSNRDFKYKDDVEAGVLISNLEELEYIEFQKKDKNKRLHKITEKGIAFLSENVNK